MEFRGKRFPGCLYHERPLMRCARMPHGNPTIVVAYNLVCPDCVSDYYAGRAGCIRTPIILITREEYETLPVNPHPVMIHTHDGSYEPLE